MPATAVTTEPEALVLSRAEAMLVMAKEVVVACAMTVLPVSVVEERVAELEALIVVAVTPPLNAICVVVALLGNG